MTSLSHWQVNHFNLNIFMKLVLFLCSSFISSWDLHKYSEFNEIFPCAEYMICFCHASTLGFIIYPWGTKLSSRFVLSHILAAHVLPLESFCASENNQEHLTSKFLPCVYEEMNFKIKHSHFSLLIKQHKASKLSLHFDTRWISITFFLPK